MLKTEKRKTETLQSNIHTDAIVTVMLYIVNAQYMIESIQFFCNSPK
jgi:hypothetical protein